MKATILSLIIIASVIMAKADDVAKKADDYFILTKTIAVCTSEQDCELLIKAEQVQDGSKAFAAIMDSGRVGTLAQGLSVIVKQVGTNGIDVIRLVGYPNDLFTPNLITSPDFGQYLTKRKIDDAFSIPKHE